jgi:hypothetical protein
MQVPLSRRALGVPGLRLHEHPWRGRLGERRVTQTVRRSERLPTPASSSAFSRRW